MSNKCDLIDEDRLIAINETVMVENREIQKDGMRDLGPVTVAKALHDFSGVISGPWDSMLDDVGLFNNCSESMPHEERLKFRGMVHAIEQYHPDAIAPSAPPTVREVVGPLTVMHQALRDDTEQGQYGREIIEAVLKGLDLPLPGATASDIEQPPRKIEGRKD